MQKELVALRALGAVARRPRLADAMFRFEKWGNPFSEDRMSDPYPILERMRADGEVIYRKAFRQWFVFGYDEVLDVLRSPNISTGSAVSLVLQMPDYRRLTDRARTDFTNWLVIQDPPNHTRMRAAVARAFTPRSIASWQPTVQRVTDELLEQTAGQREVDIVEAFTSKLPIDVIGSLLGLPHDRLPWLREASSKLGHLPEALMGFDPVAVSRHIDELHDYFADVVAEKRARPTDDLISALASDRDDNVLTPDEVISMIGLLLFAGHETLTGVLGNAILALARFPDQRAALRNRTVEVDNAVEELLRFDTSVQNTVWIASGDVRVGDHVIPTGGIIAVMLAAANRDTRRWPDADALRLDREHPQSVSFGNGIHYCIGAALARLEVRTAIPALLDAFGDYTVDASSISWKRLLTLRGPSRIVIRRTRA